MNFAFELQKDKPLREDKGPSRGYRMIKSFDIKNFRCFKELSLTDLPTINIVVGDNGSGKTALLEALLLTAYAHPQAAQFIRVSRKRTLPSAQVNWSRDFFQSLWVDLFFSFDHSNAVQARFTDSLGDEYRVKLYYPQTTISPALSVADAIPPLEMPRSGPNDKSITAQLRIDDKGNPVWDGSLEWHPAVYLLSTTQFLPNDMVEMFGRVSKQNLKDDFLEAIKADFKEILDIEILPDGSDYALFATIKAPEKTKIPLAVVSAGAARYVNTLLAVILHNKGIVLVDEIENGLYWEKMPNIWERLREICVERGVQLFATTHSNECLRSLMGAMQGHEDDFSLIRTVVTKGKHSVEQFTGRPFAALKGRGEIR